MKKDNKNYNIFIFEDNPGDFLLVSEFLEEEIVAPRVYQVDNFKKGEQLLSKVHDQIDIILLDLTLPDKKGEELLHEILELAGHIPVIVLTGYTDVSFAIKSLSLGASDYLVKDSLNSTVLYKSIIYNIERNNHLVQIKYSEERYADLFHLSPQPMWVNDLETLQFLDVNDAAISHYGYSFEEFMKMTIHDIRVDPTLSKVNGDVSKANGKLQEYFKDEYIHKKKNGEEIIVDLRSNVMDYNNRKAEVVLATDITDRYRYMKAIEEQNALLREIAWTQSHVVRAPVARLMGLADLIKNDDLSKKERNQFLQNITSSAEEIDGIIREIVEQSQKLIDQESRN